MTAADENTQVLRLVQAMIGAISPNFRSVTLELDPTGSVSLRFLLATDDPDDREEISDIVFEFEALQETKTATKADVICSARPPQDLQLGGRPVYGRRE